LIVLALEVETARRETECATGDPSIRDKSLANLPGGAPRIHGDLLKLGIDVGQISVAPALA
jgi:hypothetical protein